MNISRIFILRPIATSLLMVALLLSGLLAYHYLPMAALPQIDYPTIQVQTLYPGASSEVMAAVVTSPLERQLGTMSGLVQMTSLSSAGASVITRSSCRNVSDAWGMALCADFIIANTVVMARAVRALSGTAVPVLWWLHDAFAGYPHIAHQIPTQLGENVRVYSVGSHAANAMRAVRPEFEIRPLIYGLPDYAAENFVRTDLGYNHGRPLFATVGSFERRKGHDIFCKAIRLLPPEVREKASFLFVGQAADKEMMDSVRALTADYPENVYYCKRLTRDEIKSLMEQCTGLVCASRDDPMPTFVTEGLIFGKPSIVSEHTGTAGLISEGRNGFVYHNDDPQQLAVLLEHAIEHPEELASMRTECRKMYEQYYSKEAFEQTLRAAVEDLTAKK